jgi:MFS family permease
MEKYVYAAFSKTFIIIGNFSTEIYLSYLFSLSGLSIKYFALSDFTGLFLGIAVQIPLGRMLDSRNKKNILLSNQLIISAFLFSIYLNFDFPRLLLMYLVSVVLGLFGGIAYSTANSLLRHLSDGINTSTINGYSEIFGQLPSIAGGFVFFLTSRFIDFRSSFLMSSIIDLCSIVLIIFIPYDHTIHIPPRSSRQKKTIDMAQRFRLSNYGTLTMFVLILNIPFVLVVTGNFLYPIYIVNELHAGANFIAINGSIYGISALSSGFLFPKIYSRYSQRKIYLLPFAIFSLGILGIAVTRSPIIFLSMSIFIGLGNGSSRILRNTVIMKRVENQYIGRYNTRLSSLVYVMRSIILLFYFLCVIYLSMMIAIYIDCLLVTILLIMLFLLDFQNDKTHHRYTVLSLHKNIENKGKY